MKIDFTAVGLIISLGTNFILLYSRKKKWATNKLRWSVCGTLFFIGLVSILSERSKINKDFYFFSWCMITPVIYNSLDRIFKTLSMKKNSRDFYLWLRGSDEIDDTLFGKNPHIKALDRLFSLLLLFSIISLPLFGIK